MRRTALLLVAVLIGCGSEDSTGGTPAADTASGPSSRSAAPATAAPRSSIQPPGHAYADADIPVPGDYAETAEKDITEANYEERLGALQSEIATAMKTQGMKPTAGAPHSHEHEHEAEEKHAHPHDHAHGAGHDHHAEGHGHEHTHDGGDKHAHPHDHAEGKGHSHSH